MKYFVIALVILGLDQVSKFLITTNFVLGESLRLLPYLYFTYVLNPGAAFGFLKGFQWIFILLGFLVVFLVWYYRKYINQQNLVTKLGITFAIAGTIGNLIDRVRVGAVIDFIDLTVFPIFNIADMAIISGVILLFWEVLTDGCRQKKSD